MELVQLNSLSPLAAPGASARQRALQAVVIGTGKISESHLRFLAQSDMARLVGVCDLSPALASFACSRFGDPQPFTDYSQMLRELRPDVVHVLTPPHTHDRIIRDCLQAGAHVIAEKPVSTSYQGLRALLDWADRCGRRIIEDHNYRFNDSICRIEQLVAQGRLGTVCDVDVRLALGIREAGGRYADANLPHPSHQLPCGVLHEFITHLCYLLLRFVPSVETVRPIWSNLGGGSLFRFDDLDAVVIGGGVHGRLRFSARTRPECFMVTVRGTKGWVETDLFQPYFRLIEPRLLGRQLSPLLNHIANGLSFAGAGFKGFYDKVMQKTPLHGLHAFLDQSYDALLTGAAPPVSYDDMKRVSVLVDRLLAEGITL
jgi:predicted dehydrogenase